MGSSDPQFEPKAIGIIGPYLNPPQYAAVFRFDEKTAPKLFSLNISRDARLRWQRFAFREWAGEPESSETKYPIRCAP